MVFINKMKIGYTYNLDVLPPFYEHVPHENGQFSGEAWGASHFPLHLAMGFWLNGEDANVQPQIHCVCSWGCRLTTICGHVFRLARWPSFAQHRNAAQLQNSTSMVHRGCHSDETPHWTQGEWEQMTYQSSGTAMAWYVMRAIQIRSTRQIWLGFTSVFCSFSLIRSP